VKDFECVELEGVEPSEGHKEPVAEPREKPPRRVIHFSSGETMEEYSTDEEEDEETPMKKDVVTVDTVS
jgi:hypothetical protein